MDSQEEEEEVLERLSSGSPTASPAENNTDKSTTEKQTPNENGAESNEKSEEKSDEENTLKIDEGPPDPAPESVSNSENAVMQPIVPPAEKPLIKKEKKTSRVVVSHIT